MIEIAGDLVHELDRRRDIDRLDVDLQQRCVCDPGLVLDLDRVVADADDEIGGAQEGALQLPARALDAADGERMALVDHALGHGRGGKRQIVPLDDAQQQLRVVNAHGRGAQHGYRPLGRAYQLARALERSLGRWGKLACARRLRQRLVGGGKRDVLRQIEMHWPLRLAQRDTDRMRERFRDGAAFERQGGLGDRLEQRMMVDPHLHAPAKLVGVEVAGDGDHGRAIEPRVAHAGGEISGPRSQSRKAEAGSAGHAPGHVSGESRRAFVGGEHEIDAAFAHRLHERKHISARNPEAAGDSIRFERCDDQIGIVHGNGISTITGQQQVTAGILRWHAHLRCRRPGTTRGQILLTQ